MERIKFISTDNQQHQFTIAVRKNVYDYFKEKGISTKGNFLLAIQSICMLSIYIIPFIIILTIPINIWLAIVMTIIMGIGMAGIGMCIMHDAAHGSFSEKEWINKTLSSTMYLLGANVNNWKLQHNTLHHVFTNIEGYDKDIEPNGPIRLSQHSPLQKIHKYQYIYAFFFYGLLTLSKLYNDFPQMKSFHALGITRQHFNITLEYVKMAMAKMAYLFIFIGLPIIFTNFYWWQVVIGFFIMNWIAGCILSVIFQLAHVLDDTKQPVPNAAKIIENEWTVHQLQTTSDFARNNHFLFWYIGGLNFQIEHHLFMNISHIHYRLIAPIVERTAKEYGIFYNLKPTFTDAFNSHLNRLKTLGSATPI